MPTARRPRRGSLQFYPRKRAAKNLPSVHWDPVLASAKNEGLLGLIAYKVGMATAIVKDTTDKSMTSGKRIAVPVTILEVPPIKIFSVRFYKNNKVFNEIVVSHDKDLKRRIKVPKSTTHDLSKIPESYDDIRVIIYTLPREISLKKTPDLLEIALHAKDKLAFVKSLLTKQISIADLAKTPLLDIRGVTKGKGFQGPVKRFGIGLRQHKSEKGVRRPGSIGPWHPAHVTFRTPMAGQLGMFSRTQLNTLLINSNTTQEKDINPISGFKHYGKITNSYVLVKGSVQGPPKRQVALTVAFRPTKTLSKTKYEFIELITKTP